MENPFGLSGKRILITGASSGIGKSIAIECAKFGAELIITGRNAFRLQETLNILSGENHTAITADLTIESEIINLVDQINNLDGVVNVAGIADPKPFVFTTKNDMENIMNSNFFAPVLVTNLAMKSKKINKGASIIFISSISGNLCTYMGNSIYSASKAALNGVVKSLALEFAPKKIRVNTIMPAMIETPILNNTSISEEDILKDKKKYPLGRYGKPEEIAYAAVYLLSNASSWVTGSNLLIDGGYTLL